MSIKDKIPPKTDANLHISFDVGHSSIGWAVLEKTGAQISDIKINGCGSVVFRADDCLASSRRAYRRQRRHIRSTRQRIARMKILLKHLGFLTEKELDKPGCAWSWKLAAQILQSGKLLTWPELWDVLRWYAHNRGYDGNQRWSNNSEVESEATELDDAALDKILKDASATEDEKKDAEKVIEAKNLMRRHGVRTMAETFCKELGIEPKGEKKSSMKRFKGLNAAFPRKTVETEVLQILQAHKFCDAKFIHFLLAKKLSDEDRAFLKSAGIRIPKRYEGGLLFGQLVPRFDNRIISICPISGQKVPSRNCPEFLNFRWAMQLANIRVGQPNDRELRPLNPAERAELDKAIRRHGYLTTYKPDYLAKHPELQDGDLTGLVRKISKCTRDNLDTMLMHPDAKEALLLDPVQKMISSDDFQPFWKSLPERLQKRLRGKWRRGKVFSLAQIRTQLESLGDASAFDAELQRQIDAHNSRAKKKEKQITREDLLQKHFPSKPLKLDGRAAFARHLLKQAYEEVMAGKHPKEKDGCLFISEEIREKELNRKIDEQTNNHLVRHRLLILERVLNDIIKEYADGKKERVGKITIEVNRDLREMSGKSAKEKAQDLGIKISHHHKVAAKLEEQLKDERFNGLPIRINAGLIRKARIADDLGQNPESLSWPCPYSRNVFTAIDLVKRTFDKDHIIPRSKRMTDALEALVITSSDINKEKGQLTGMAFIKLMNRPENLATRDRLQIRSVENYKRFVESLPPKSDPVKLKKAIGHNRPIDDDLRRWRRKQFLLTETYEEKGFTPGDLTKTSQLVRLGAQILRKNLPHLTTADVTSLPGSVTGTVRKGWKLEGCLSLANPQVMEDALDENGKKIRRAKNKKEIRGITHLHHALDACVLGIAAIRFQNNPKIGETPLWELLVKRKYNQQEKADLQALKLFKFDSVGNGQLTELSDDLKKQICQRLAEKRVVQHIPADTNGLAAEETVWRVMDFNDNHPSAKNLKRLFKEKGIIPPEAESEMVYIVRRIRKEKGAIKPKKLLNETGIFWLAYDEVSKSKLVGLKPSSKDGASKLKPLKAAKVIADNFGVALDPQPAVIPFHKVWPRLQELKKTNGEKMPRVLRNGQLIRVKDGTYKGIWRILSIKNKKGGVINLDLGQPDTVRSMYDWENPETGKKMKKITAGCKLEAALKTIIAGGLAVDSYKLTGVAVCSATSPA